LNGVSIAASAFQTIGAIFQKEEKNKDGVLALFAPAIATSPL
jgi:hypothetical protein